jgi:hypothetical protein
MTEQWCRVPGWEHRYEVSDMGRIRSFDMLVGATNKSLALRHGRMLVQVPKQERYLAVTFAEGERREQHLVHYVVLAAFVGPKPENLHALHRDDDRGNNALDNLYYGTPQQNSEDRVANGKSGKGESHPSARLTEKDVLEIRNRNGENRELLAAQFGVSASHIWHIMARKCWRHI